jgi:hypothetical protein
MLTALDQEWDGAVENMIELQNLMRDLRIEDN